MSELEVYVETYKTTLSRGDVNEWTLIVNELRIFLQAINHIVIENNVDDGNGGPPRVPPLRVDLSFRLSVDATVRMLSSVFSSNFVALLADLLQRYDNCCWWCGARCKPATTVHR